MIGVTKQAGEADSRAEFEELGAPLCSIIAVREQGVAILRNSPKRISG